MRHIDRLTGNSDAMRAQTSSRDTRHSFAAQAHHSPPHITAMASGFALPDARRIRSYIFRLPLATRLLTLALLAFYIAHLFNPNIEQWGALIPSEMNLQSRKSTYSTHDRHLLTSFSVYRLNTYPLTHKSFPHFALNTLTLLPLLDRFESEHGTLVTLILFTGPFGTVPGGLYTLLERFILHINGAAVGASVWVFLLLASESIKQWRANPHFSIGDARIPTWVTPLAGICVVSFLVPHTSFLGHMCGAVVGYLWGLGWLRFLAPSEWILRWIEGKLNLLGRIPHYVSVDQKTYGRYGVLPTTAGGPQRVGTNMGDGVPLGPVGSPRLGD